MAVKNTNNRFHNIYFDRFMNAIMSEPLRPEVFRHLTDLDRRAMANRSEFLNDAGLEDKLMILSKLGVPFVIVAGVPIEKKLTKLFIERLVSLFFKLLTFKKKLILKMLRDKQLFVMADLDFVKSLKLASNIYNSPTATTFSGYRFALDRMYKYTHIAQQNAVKDAAAGHDLDGIIITALITSMHISAQDGFKHLYGISPRQFLILAVLSRQREITLSALAKMTHGIRWQNADLMLLLKNGLIERRRVQEEFDSDFHYWLTGVGEQTLIKARKHFISHL